MGTTDEKSLAAAALDDSMLAMDVAETLGERPELADSPEQLRAFYAELGLTLSDPVLSHGVAGYRAGSFRYVAPTTGLRPALARLYVVRRHWLPGVLAVSVALILGLGGYFLVYQPYAEAQAKQARLELSQTIPAQLDDLFETIYEETKVQAAVTQATGLRDAGRTAAAKGDRSGALSAVADLTRLRDRVRADYRLTVADRPGVKWGFWAFPENNSDETDYYLVVDVTAADGTPLAIPVATGTGKRTETVSTFAQRVPEEVYRAVEADAREDGRIDRPLVAIKQFGYLDPNYTVDVLDGTLTRW